MLTPTKSVFVTLAAFAVVFWGLRFAYWHGTQEVIFSDMQGYLCVAKQIVRQPLLRL